METQIQKLIKIIKELESRVEILETKLK